jgi:hypothetical protein
MNKAMVDLPAQQVPVLDDSRVLMPLVCSATFVAGSAVRLAKSGELTIKAIGGPTEPEVVIPKPNNRHDAIDSLRV